MSLYTSIFRPLLFRLPPERAQALAETALRRYPLSQLFTHAWAPTAPELRTTLAGIPLRSPVGLAAGYDKHCDILGPLMNLGFGYVGGGTVTLHPQPGNPPPRLLRLPDQQALVNAMGFPSKGLDHAEARLRALKNRPVALLVSISGLSTDEFLQCHRRLEPLTDAIELNISSPNTVGIRVFQEPNTFADLANQLNAQRAKPLFVKLPPYSDEAGQKNVLALVRRCVELGVSGVTVANTKPVEDERMKVGRGGLSGPPLLPDTLRMVRELRAEVGDKLTINACGGISAGDDALHALQSGADTLQLFTALVYQGPGIVSAINRHLVRHCRERSLSSISELAKT